MRCMDSAIDGCFRSAHLLALSVRIRYAQERHFVLGLPICPNLVGS